jgi:hypothetical protein
MTKSASIDTVVFTLVLLAGVIGLCADTLRGWLIW